MAATLIALDVLRDGARHSWRALKTLLDERPSTTAMKPKTSPEIETAREAVEALPWVEQADVRLCEEGALISRTVLVQPSARTENLPERLAEAREKVLETGWRLYEVQVVPSGL